MTLQIEGPQLLQHGFNDAIAKVGLTKFVTDLFWVGMFYHLYNQVFQLVNAAATLTKTCEKPSISLHTNM